MQEISLPKEVIVAIVAAVSALIVAVISLLSALRSAREQRATQLQLETVKDEIASRVERRRKTAENIKMQIDLIASDVELIQDGRDILRKAIDSPQGVLKTSDFLLRLDECIKSIEDQYGKRYARDISGNGKYLHNAKGVLIAVSQLIELHKADYVSELSTENVTNARNARAQLQSLQENLRNESMKLTSSYMEI